MQTLTKLLLDQGLQNHILTDAQVARLIEGSAQRRHSLVNRAIKAGELQRVRRGLYLLPRRYRDYDCHPFALAQMLSPGGYISLETALHYHGWIPEAVYTTASIVPGAKSSDLEVESMGRFGFRPLAFAPGYFLELVSREIVNQQAALVARPVRALMDLVCLRKEEWQGLAWFEQSLRIEAEALRTITGDQLRTLKLVYKHKRMQCYLREMEKALGLELGSAGR